MLRWIPFIIAAYVLVLFQTTVLGLAALNLRSIGPVMPDALAILVVFIALQTHGGSQCMIAGWILGLAVDLTTGSGTVVGPMSIAYALGAGGVFQVREALFAERPITQVFVVLGFCLFAHGLWVTLQVLRAGHIGGGVYGLMLLQAMGVSLYTSLLAPLAYFGLIRIRGWFIISQRGRSRR